MSELEFLQLLLKRKTRLILGANMLFLLENCAKKKRKKLFPASRRDLCSQVKKKPDRVYFDHQNVNCLLWQRIFPLFFLNWRKRALKGLTGWKHVCLTLWNELDSGISSEQLACCGRGACHEFQRTVGFAKTGNNVRGKGRILHEPLQHILINKIFCIDFNFSLHYQSENKNTPPPDWNRFWEPF